MINPMAMAQSGYGGGNFGGMEAGGFNGQYGNGMGWNNGWNGQGNMGYNQGMGGMRNGGYYSAASAGGYNHQSQGSHQVPSQQYQNPHFQRQQNFARGGGYAGGPGSGSGAGGNRSYHPEPSASSSSPPPAQQRQQQQPQQQQASLEDDAAFQQQLQGIEEVKKAPSSVSGGESKGEKIPSVVSDDQTDNNIDVTPAITAEMRNVPVESESTVLVGAGDAGSDGNVHPGLMNSDTTAVGYPMGPQDEFSGQGVHNHPQQPYINGFSSRGNFRGNFRGGFRGNFGPGMRGGSFGVDGAAVPNGPVAPDAKVIGEVFGKGVEGAPTGPKAMREGRSNRGIMSRGGGIGFAGRGGSAHGGAGSPWSRSVSHFIPERYI
jgi:hypothetical protein